jgi:hypothetical protein
MLPIAALLGFAVATLIKAFWGWPGIGQQTTLTTL